MNHERGDNVGRKVNSQMNIVGNGSGDGIYSTMSDATSLSSTNDDNKSKGEGELNELMEELQRIEQRKKEALERVAELKKRSAIAVDVIQEQEFSSSSANVNAEGRTKTTSTRSTISNIVAKAPSHDVVNDNGVSCDGADGNHPEIIEESQAVFPDEHVSQDDKIDDGSSPTTNKMQEQMRQSQQELTKKDEAVLSVAGGVDSDNLHRNSATKKGSSAGITPTIPSPDNHVSLQKDRSGNIIEPRGVSTDASSATNFTDQLPDSSSGAAVNTTSLVLSVQLPDHKEIKSTTKKESTITIPQDYSQAVSSTEPSLSSRPQSYIHSVHPQQQQPLSSIPATPDGKKLSWANSDMEEASRTTQQNTMVHERRLFYSTTTHWKELWQECVSTRTAFLLVFLYGVIKFLDPIVPYVEI